MQESADREKGSKPIRLSPVLGGNATPTETETEG
jgi:hypothetical protein